MAESTHIYNLEWAPDAFNFAPYTSKTYQFLWDNSQSAIYGSYGSLVPWNYNVGFEDVIPFNQDKVYHGYNHLSFMLGFLIILFTHRRLFLYKYNWPDVADGGTTYQSLIDSKYNGGQYEGDVIFGAISGDDIDGNPFIEYYPYQGMFKTNGLNLDCDYLCPLIKEIVINIWNIYQPKHTETSLSYYDYYWVDPTSETNARLQILPEFKKWVDKINDNPDFECTIGDFDEMYFWCKRQLSWMRKIILYANVTSLRITRTVVKHDFNYVKKYLTASNTTYDIHGLFNRGGYPFSFNPDNPTQTWIQPAYSYYDVPGASNYYRTGYNQDGTKKFWQRVPEIFCARGEGITIWPSTGMERISVGSGIITGTTAGPYGYFQAHGFGQIFSSFDSMADYHNFVLHEYLYHGYMYPRAIKKFNFGRFVTSADGNFNIQYYNEPTYGYDSQYSYYSNVFRISPWTRFIESFPCRRIIGGVQTDEISETVYYDTDNNTFNTFLTSIYGCYHRSLFTSPFTVRDISGKNNIVSENWPANQPLEEYTKEYTFTITHTTTENYDPEIHQINANFYINPDINNVEIKINGETITQNLLQNPDRFSSPDEDGFRYMYDVGKVVSVYVRNLHTDNDLEYSNSSTQEISAATTIQCFNATYWQGTASNGWGEHHFVYDVLNIYPKQIPANYVTTKTASFPYTAPNSFEFAYKRSNIVEREDEE